MDSPTGKDFFDTQPFSIGEAHYEGICHAGINSRYA